MEEILASIRRIIAEDNEAPAAAAAESAVKDAPAAVPDQVAVAPLADDVLELTEIVEEDKPVANASADAPVPAHALSEPPTLKPDPEAPAQRIESEMTGAPDRLVSSSSAAASVASLSQLIQRGPRDRGGELPLGAVERTLEDIVRELLRPLLRDWLDEHLPKIVERLVHEEITRLARETQGR